MHVRCSKCRHRWPPRVKQPLSCPRCRRYGFVVPVRPATPRAAPSAATVPRVPTHAAVEPVAEAVST